MIHPQIELSKITLNEALAKRLPRQIAYYHLAIPIAQDDEAITVVMAHADNPNAIRLLTAVLETKIVPVQGQAQEIIQTLQKIWPEADHDQPPQVSVWSDTPEKIAWGQQYAVGMFTLPAQQITILQSATNAHSGLSPLPQKGESQIMVTHMPQQADLKLVLGPDYPSLLLFSGPPQPLRRILVILRGHAPDFNVLHGILSAVQQNTTVTLLMVASASANAYIKSQLTDFIQPDTVISDHLAACTHYLWRQGVQGSLRLRQGTPEVEIAHEVHQNSYDLVAIATEAYGDFVHRVMECVDTDASFKGAIFVVKP